MRYTQFASKPEIFEKEDNGVVIYNSDIQVVKEDTDEGIKTSYTAVRVCLHEPINSDIVLAKTIEAMWPPSVENKLVNDYQAATLGLADEMYIDRYKEFLKERAKLKLKVEQDYEKNYR